MHPDGRTIFVSVQDERELNAPGSTFCFDVDDESNALKGVFDWTLPFRGRCHFVNELNAWVGRSKSYDSIGHLCACPVVTPGHNSSRPCWKISKEDVFSNNLAEHHVGATLV